MLWLYELRAVSDAVDGVQRDVRQVARVGDCAAPLPGKPDISSFDDLSDTQVQLCVLSPMLPRDSTVPFVYQI